MYFLCEEVVSMVKVYVANDNDEDIYVSIFTDTTSKGKSGLKTSATVAGNQLCLKWNKEVTWDAVDKKGYTQINSKRCVPFYPNVGRGSIYVTIFSAKDKRQLCLCHPVARDRNVIFSFDGCICIAKRKTCWKYNNYVKPSKTVYKEKSIYQFTQKIKEKDKLIETLTYELCEYKQSPDSRKRKHTDTSTPEIKPNDGSNQRRLVYE